MLKTMLTLAALATLATGTVAPAHAIRILQGIGENGSFNNGGGENGQFNNGLGENGQFNNGQFNNGDWPNGAQSGSSTLSIQAIELPSKSQ